MKKLFLYTCLIIAFFACNFKKKSADELFPLPKDVDYGVVHKESLMHLKKIIVRVEINKVVDNKILEIIANRIKYNNEGYDSLFIYYFLPQQKKSDKAWATTHFTPDLHIEANDMTKFYENLQNKKKLTAQELEQLKKTNKKRADYLYTKMRIKEDAIAGITWFTDKSSPNYLNTNAFYAYIGRDINYKAWLRLIIRYCGDDWLFINKIIINVDGENYQITENEYDEFKSDNSGGQVWEYVDRKVTDSEYEIIKKVSESTKANVRFSGKQYYKDITISQQQKQALKNIVELYEIFKSVENY